MKAKKFVASVLVVGLLATVSGCGKKTEATTTKVAPTAVKVAAVEKGKVANEITISGKVSAGMDVNVVPKMAGKVMQVAVDVGDKVTKGQVLVRLDSTDIEVQLRSAEAGLKVTQATQDQGKIRYEDAKKNYDRMQYLFSQGAVSQQQLDAAKNAFDLAAANYNPNGGQTMTAAQLEQARAQIATLKQNLNNTIVTAPMDGVVSARMIDPGEMAGPTAPVLTLVNDTTVKVEGNLSESEINLVQPGDTVRVIVKAAGTEPFTGKVVNVAPSANPQTKVFPITIEIDNSKALLKSGMVAEVYLNTQAKEDVIVVPKEAVLERTGKKVVFVHKAGKVEEKQVEVGITDTKLVEITKGIEVGDEIVVQGQQLLADQAPVTVKGGGK